MPAFLAVALPIAFLFFGARLMPAGRLSLLGAGVFLMALLVFGQLALPAVNVGFADPAPKISHAAFLDLADWPR